jgi:catechol 2,3-dioxygenase-like lactoylglutathione lyase family enzyme
VKDELVALRGDVLVAAEDRVSGTGRWDRIAPEGTSNSTDHSGIAERSNSWNRIDNRDKTWREARVAEWEKQIGAVNLVVGDLERSKAFYREVFGLSPLHEDEDVAVFRFKEVYLSLHRDPAHQDAPSGEALALAQKGVGQFAFIVESADAVRAQLEERGVTVISGPADRHWGMRTITFADPAGYIWEIAQEVSDARSP